MSEFEELEARVRAILTIAKDFKPTGEYQKGQVAALLQAYREIFGDT